MSFSATYVSASGAFILSHNCFDFEPYTVDNLDFTGGDVTKEKQWSHRSARLALVQLNASHQNSPEAELIDMLEGWIAKAANDSADLVLLPECVLVFIFSFLCVWLT